LVSKRRSEAEVSLRSKIEAGLSQQQARRFSADSGAERHAPGLGPRLFSSGSSMLQSGDAARGARRQTLPANLDAHPEATATAMPARPPSVSTALSWRTGAEAEDASEDFERLPEWKADTVKAKKPYRI